jgi:hypothetical protein
MIHSGRDPVNIRLGCQGLAWIHSTITHKIAKNEPKSFRTLAPQQRKTRKNIARYKKIFQKKHSSLVAQECE